MKNYFIYVLIITIWCWFLLYIGINDEKVYRVAIISITILILKEIIDINNKLKK